MPAKKTMKILMVDDNREIRELVKATLDPEEYRIVEAVSGEAGVEAALAERPDLIIMDLMLPGKMNGFDAIRAIQKADNRRKCPFIILSGSGESLGRKNDLDGRDLTYFRKPFSPLDLIDKIEDLLGTKG